MNDRTEADLVRVLADAAEHAPVPDRDLAGAVRVRRRAHRTRMALACAAVVAIAAGGTVAVRNALPTGNGPVSPAVQGPSEFAIRPASEVWPGTVTTIPKKTADGLNYWPVAALSPTTLLLIARSPSERTRLDTYDTTTGRGTPLVRMPSRGGKRLDYAQSIEVGDEAIAWWGKVQGKSIRVDFWVAPKAGGTARKVGEVMGALADVERIGVTRDSLVWSVYGGGVYRMPLEGGAPQPVPGGEGLTLISWPWASDVSAVSSRNQTKLVNLATEQTLPVNSPEGANDVRCGLVWCVDILGKETVVHRIDGGDLRTLPGSPTWERILLPGARTGFANLAQRDRYAAVVYDPETGLAGGIGNLAKDRGSWGTVSFSSSSSFPSIIYADPPSNDRCEEKADKCPDYLVINLLALPAP